MKKRVLALLMAAVMVFGLAACGNKDEGNGGSSNDGNSSKIEDVNLVVWGAEEDQTMLREMINEFIEANKSKVNLTVDLGVESESTAKDTVLTDVEAAADVFAFADDQLTELLAAGALQEVSSAHKDAVIAANGGAEAGAVLAASKDGKLYAYPMTADNGYFMFYNKEYFTEEDVKSMDKMLEVAAAAGKKLTMEIDNGWYLYSFFQAAGLEMVMNEDQTNSCNWNAIAGTYTGVDVAEGILRIAKSSAFANLTDAEFATGVKDGSIIAGINGVWNAVTAEEAWGSNYAAAKLPTYTVKGDQLQMASFAGYKLMGVNAYSKNVGWAMELANWLTNEDNQVKRFEMRGLGPSNVKAAASEEVKTNPAISALAVQSAYATVQRVGAKFWEPATTFGAIMKQGNPEGTDLQTLLDNLVAGITAPIE